MAIIRPQKALEATEKIITPRPIANPSIHSLLVGRAQRWLSNTVHCRVVLSELVALTNSGETPDAIGWVNGWCILTEAKASRSDFFADKKKMSRLPDMPALGHWTGRSSLKIAHIFSCFCLPTLISAYVI
jgi:hypothetical protein